MTALRASRPSARAARALSALRMKAEISCGVYSSGPIGTRSPEPIRRLMESTVRSGSEDGLVAGPAPDDDVAGLVQPDARGHDGVAILANHLRPPAGDDRHLGVGRAEVDADDGL